jgi:hypothetical protein
VTRVTAPLRGLKLNSRTSGGNHEYRMESGKPKGFAAYEVVGSFRNRDLGSRSTGCCVWVADLRRKQSSLV